MTDPSAEALGAGRPATLVTKPSPLHLRPNISVVKNPLGRLRTFLERERHGWAHRWPYERRTSLLGPRRVSVLARTRPGLEDLDPITRSRNSCVRRRQAWDDDWGRSVRRMPAVIVARTRDDHSRLARRSSAAVPVSTNGHTRNHTTGVRAPVTVVSAASTTRTTAVTR